MWLDRFSAPSGTPPPQGRAYSPAPRRPYNPSGPGSLPLRPGLPSRTSSLSLVSPGSSTTSLPIGARGHNGADRRRQGVPPLNVPDPLQVLESILGASPRRALLGKGESSATTQPVKPVELVDNIDFGGLSLQEFAQESKLHAQELAPVHTYSAQSVEEYDKEKDKFEDLHRSILACDEVLKSVEMYLTNFQSDLGAVSAEIETLQSRSTALNTKLENRKVVEKLLGPAVEDISISPAVVKRISEGPIDDNFLRALGELEKRSKSINSKAKDNTHIKALEDVKPMLDDLTNKAVERIRDYIVAQIKAIRSPSINAQIIQQQAFLQYKELFTFLAKHQPQLAEEIGKAYMYTMRWYYLNHFSRYQKALEKLKIHALDKYDVLGEENNVKRGPLLGNHRGAPANHDAFSLGRRIDLLKNPSHTALTAYVAEEEDATHYLEVPFRTFNLALIDNASFEFAFLTTYFSPMQNFHAISRSFMTIFEPTFALGQSLTKQLVETTTDGLGILLCVRLNQHFAFEMQRRKVPTVEGYINATNMLLWPRFQLVIDQHCESLRKLTASLPIRAASSASILTSSSASQSTTPHPLTQKFANLLQGILSLSSEAGDDEPVSNSLSRLRSDFEAYLTRLSKGIAEQRKRERFLCNNYSLICTIVADSDGRLADEVKSHFETLRDAFDH